MAGAVEVLEVGHYAGEDGAFPGVKRAGIDCAEDVYYIYFSWETSGFG